MFNSRLFRVALLAAILAGTFSAGLFIRRSVLNAQYLAAGSDLPFTLESALHYRRVKILHDRGELPAVDPAIQHPEGIRIREIDAVASEPVQVFFARLFPDSMPFPDRIRWIESSWFCLGIPLLAIAVRIWTGSWIAGLFSALFYACSMASVLRSTGQEISRENFAFPWLIASFAFAAAFFRSAQAAAKPFAGRTRFAILSSLCISLALIGWDMVQYVVGLVALCASAHIIFNRTGPDRAVLKIYTWMAAGIFITGLLHPYHRFHGLAWSPMMLWLASVAVAGWWAARQHSISDVQRSTFTSWKRAAVVFGPAAFVLALGATGAYGSSYEHFAELLWAKIRFLNVKPDDPGLLTYYQRVMWVPALHSATWGLTKWMFPLLLWVVLFIAMAAWFDSLKRPDPLTSFWLIFFFVSVISYVFFVRFHVFAALSAAVLAGWLYGRYSGSSMALRGAVVLVLSFALMAEAGHTLREKKNMGRPNVYYAELDELADWLKEHVAPEPVVANMGVSAYIAAYGKCPIAIHPKFEDPTIRRRLMEFAECMFGTDEKSLRDWMDTIDTSYVVYAKGEFATEKPEYQMRYFVDRMNPPDTAPARRFEREDETMRYFKRLWGNRKYVVYQALTGVEQSAAQSAADSAMKALLEGRLPEAEELAIEALRVDRHQETALKVMRHVGSLMDQGVDVHP